MSRTADLSNSIRGRYINDYIKGAKGRQVYEQFCYPISKDKEILQNSSSVTVPFLAEMSVNAQTISETVDIEAQSLNDATASISPTSRADGMQDSEKLLLQAYTDYAQERFNVLGRNMMSTLEARAIDKALAGLLVQRNAARAALDAGTAGDRLSDVEFFKAGNQLAELECPAIVDKEGNPSGHGFMSVMHPDVFFDLLSSGLVDDISMYQDKGIWLNGALHTLNGFQIISSPWAKVFMGAGANNTTDADYVLTSDAAALAKSLAITTATNVAVGRYLALGTEESGNTFYPMNERITHSSGTTTSVIVGKAVNGGIKYAHPAGTAVRNADSVYPVLFGGPRSVAKVFASDVGEFGKVVGPKIEGRVDQFISLAWKWYGDYAIINQNWLVRGEYSSSLDAD